MPRFSPANALSEWVRSFRLHVVTRTICADGRVAWVKRRRRGTDGVILVGSAAMKLANGGIRMFASVDRWRAWELASYRLLHGGEGYGCGRSGTRGIWTHDVPGQSLRAHARAGTLNVEMMRAAGAELRRAHRLTCHMTRPAWSHGDPHLGNVLYDAAAGRARLIDFETQHEPWRQAAWRHADDLLTFALELVGAASADAWPDLLAAVLRGYESRDVVAALGDRLRRMSCAEYLLWLARAPGSTAATLPEALATLQRIARALPFR